jgi:hypothetical protein
LDRFHQGFGHLHTVWHESIVPGISG